MFSIDIQLYQYWVAAVCIVITVRHDVGLQLSICWGAVVRIDVTPRFMVETELNCKCQGIGVVWVELN